MALQHNFNTSEAEWLPQVTQVTGVLISQGNVFDGNLFTVRQHRNAALLAFIGHLGWESVNVQIEPWRQF
jgi:hypothetical protein